MRAGNARVALFEMARPQDVVGRDGPLTSRVLAATLVVCPQKFCMLVVCGTGAG
jgi:hypothetical protein